MNLAGEEHTCARRGGAPPLSYVPTRLERAPGNALYRYQVHVRWRRHPPHVGERIPIKFGRDPRSGKKIIIPALVHYVAADPPDHHYAMWVREGSRYAPEPTALGMAHAFLTDNRRVDRLLSPPDPSEVAYEPLVIGPRHVGWSVGVERG